MILTKKFVNHMIKLILNGEDLFKDLFETDYDGIIVYVKPPSNQYTSMEVFMFIIGVMHMQHIRVLYKKVDDFIASSKSQLGIK